MFTCSATELAAMIRTKAVSSRELLDGYLDRLQEGLLGTYEVPPGF